MFNVKEWLKQFKDFSETSMSDMMLEFNFQLLNDFVEEELKKLYEEMFSKSENNPGLRLCEYFSFENSSDLDESELRLYSEVYELYTWWNFKRPIRIDPFDLSGYNKLFSNYMPLENKFYFSQKWRDENKHNYRLMMNLLKKSREIENEYDTEDQNMLKRLIDLRLQFWV